MGVYFNWNENPNIPLGEFLVKKQSPSKKVGNSTLTEHESFRGENSRMKIIAAKDTVIVKVKFPGQTEGGLHIPENSQALPTAFVQSSGIEGYEEGDEILFDTAGRVRQIDLPELAGKVILTIHEKSIIGKVVREPGDGKQGLILA